MLGSTADSLFWMFRYIERAENTLCLIESGFQLHLISSKNLKNEWDAILKTSSIRQFFTKNNTQLDSLKIINFMFKDQINSNNIYELISKARENARRSRVAMTLEVWESVNTCWLFLKEQLKKNVTENRVQSLIKDTREKIALIYGYLNKTMLKDEILNFCYLGTYIERFNNTARILNTRQYLLIEERLYGLEYYNNFQSLQPMTPANCGYSMLRSATYSEFYQGLLQLCDDMDMPLEGLHTEIGPGVLEAALAYDDVLEAADKAVLFKTFTKVFAQRNDLVATFMAKWNIQHQGQSGHTHISLRDEQGNPLFYDAHEPHRMSKMMRHFLAGVTGKGSDFSFGLMPTINFRTAGSLEGCLVTAKPKLVYLKCL